jgi:hypothetical protein
MGQDGQIRRDRIIIDTDPGIGAPPPSLPLPLFLSFLRCGSPVFSSLTHPITPAIDENSVNGGARQAEIYILC